MAVVLINWVDKYRDMRFYSIEVPQLKATFSRSGRYDIQFQQVHNSWSVFNLNSAQNLSSSLIAASSTNYYSSYLFDS